MKSSICRFINSPKAREGFQVIRFVYETEIKKLPQPFCDVIFRFMIVMSGKATLKMGDMEYFLKRGTVFFTFPCREYTISDYDDFTYTYISFTGHGALDALKSLGITEESAVFDGLEFLCGYFDSTIRHVTPGNSGLLSESALLYALAFVSDLGCEKVKRSSENLYYSIMDYVERNFTDPAMSLGLISNVYSYSPKYISALIKRNLGLGFSAYLNSLRIERARELLSKREGAVSDIALASGFSDPLYFSKVFKRLVGVSPREYMMSAPTDAAFELLKKYSTD